MNVIQTITRKIKNQAGFGMASSIFLLTLLALAGGAILEVQGADSNTMVNDYNSHKAFFVAHGGMEWAKYQISQGNKPETMGYKNFNKLSSTKGQFAVVADYATRTVSVTGAFGNAKSAQSFQPVFAADCIDIVGNDPFGSQVVGVTEASFGFQAITFKKKGPVADTRCNAVKKVILDKVTIEGLNPAKNQTYAYLRFDGTEYYNQNVAPTIGTKVSYKEGDNLDLAVEDLLNHSIQKLSMSTTYGNLPPSGSSFDVTFTFSDGSYVTKAFVLTHGY